MCIAIWGDASASEGDAEDIVQELLLAIHLKRGTWDQTRSIGPWIAVIVHNKLGDSVRRRGRHPSVPSEDLMDTLGVEDQNDGLPSGEIDRLLIQLKSEQRDMFQSFSIRGGSVRQTVRRFHTSEGAVGVALQ
jgi:DNA-directed RNA polymerase specialized sigma24 family protein